MGKPVELAGRRFGMLVAVRDVGKDKHGKRKWLFKCDCGNDNHVAIGSSALSGLSSCGCQKARIAKENSIAGREKVRQSKIKHGHSLPGSKYYHEYCTWQGMKSRCYRKKDRHYNDYGGRGIIVCDRWLHDGGLFVSDMGARPSKKHSIDRIDNDGNYEPGNCRWATTKEQANNRRVRTKNKAKLTN